MFLTCHGLQNLHLRRSYSEALKSASLIDYNIYIGQIKGDDPHRPTDNTLLVMLHELGSERSRVIKSLIPALGGVVGLQMSPRPLRTTSQMRKPPDTKENTQAATSKPQE